VEDRSVRSVIRRALAEHVLAPVVPVEPRTTDHAAVELERRRGTGAAIGLRPRSDSTSPTRRRQRSRGGRAALTQTRERRARTRVAHTPGRTGEARRNRRSKASVRRNWARGGKGRCPSPWVCVFPPQASADLGPRRSRNTRRPCQVPSLPTGRRAEEPKLAADSHEGLHWAAEPSSMTPEACSGASTVNESTSPLARASDANSRLPFGQQSQLA
jgi:hypothetical protein